MPEYIIKPIARIYTDFSERFGIPRQAGLADELTARIVFEKEFRDINALRGIESFSHLWLIWNFSKTRIDMSADPIKWSALVSPPRLGGKIKEGVFATRSPYRPNSLGLSSVKLLNVQPHTNEGPVLVVGGADILNGTEIFDIKPYLPYTDSHADAAGGFACSEKHFLNVEFADGLMNLIPKEKQKSLLQILQQDPRGAYEKQPGFVYGLSFDQFDIRFTVEENVLRVFEVLQRTNDSGSFRNIK